MLNIEQVKTKNQQRDFVSVARGIYSPESPWVRPLDSILLRYLNARLNPFYRAGTARAFLAKRGRRSVGRILAHAWHRHRLLHGERAGYFGFFECGNDREAATALFEAAAGFARSEGCDLLRGPFNMTAAQEMGVMTDGFEEPPSVDMVYTPRWYPSLLEGVGLRPCFRMQTWRNDDIISLNPDALLSSQYRELQAKANLRVRSLDSRRRAEELERIRDLVNVAFLGNWSFVPITREEWKLQIGPLVPLLDPELIQIAEIDGAAVGVTFAIPDFNRILRRMNGSLLHPRVFSLLRRPPTDGAVVILFAVRKQFQGLGVSRALNAELMRALQRRGYHSLSITWIASDNTASRAQAKALKMRRLHELAMYEQRL
jgi:GNAT superfamily N-acetyltransferase